MRIRCRHDAGRARIGPGIAQDATDRRPDGWISSGLPVARGPDKPAEAPWDRDAGPINGPLGPALSPTGSR